ncbi:Uncharacterised protein [Ectopseudomonas mendocina]|uniref:Uncharacterized protein n=1 Tax=Ectopseudomonas mendocina TaxID=300 RepID=A0A379ITD8_ECTME|nr:hypothetical protein [Pseudomonas mendocina]SUD39500.1 Uncharacterised protein [Pseudomonas mendocina]
MHTNRKLFDLATKNSQRQAANGFLSSLPSQLKAEFDKAEAIYHPELSELFSPVIHKAIELHKNSHQLMAGAKVLLTASKEKALESFFRWASRLPESEYVLVLYGGNGVAFNGAGSWVSGLPGYVFTRSAAIDVFRVMSVRGVEQAAIASKNGHHAAILETSCGFLPDEPSASEVIYEVTSW